MGSTIFYYRRCLADRELVALNLTQGITDHICAIGYVFFRISFTQFAIVAAWRQPAMKKATRSRPIGLGMKTVFGKRLPQGNVYPELVIYTFG